MTPLVANMRMYSASPEVGRLWKKLAERVADLSGVPLEILDHPPPKPLSELWRRMDMGLVQMCGWPFWCADPSPQIVASVVPDSRLAGGRPVYWTDMIVSANSRAERLEDTFGGTIAWTQRMSHSGFNAPRYFLLSNNFRLNAAPYARSLGPVETPAGAIEAICAGEADVAGLDGYYHLLLQEHDPRRAAQIRVIARTPCAPIPPLVASSNIPGEVKSALSSTMLSLHVDSKMAELLESLKIQRFVLPNPEDYRLTQDWADFAKKCRISIAPDCGRNAHGNNPA